MSVEGNTFADVGENQGGCAVYDKEQHKDGVYTPTELFWQKKPESPERRRQKADPEETCHTEAYGRKKTDIPMKIEKISGIIPIA